MLDRITHYVGIIGINLSIFILLLWSVNISCGFIIKMSNPPGRENLPNYENDRAHARAIFRDYYQVKHTYSPFVGWKTLPYHGETLTINSSGLRITTSPSNNGPGKDTVMFFGGSTTWGEGADDDHTIPALFNKLQTRYTVINQGQLAYNTRQELDALISVYSKGKNPDIVVFYDGVNDAAFLCPSVIKKLPSHRLVPVFQKQLYATNKEITAELFYNIFLNHIVDLAKGFTSNEQTQATAYDCLSNPSKANEIADIFIRNWEIANEIVTHHGGVFIALLQPASFSGHPKTDYLHLDPALQENACAVYSLIKSRIRQRNHSWIFDLTNSFDSNDHFYIDFCHVSANGNAIIAEKVSEIVESAKGQLAKWDGGDATVAARGKHRSKFINSSLSPYKSEPPAYFSDNERPTIETDARGRTKQNGNN